MTHKVNVYIQASFSPKKKGKRITWSQVNLGTVSFCLSVGGGIVQIILGGWGVNAKERVSTGFFTRFLVVMASLSYTSLSFRGTSFSIVEDTQLLLSEKKEGVYAYVRQCLVFVNFFMPQYSG